MQLHFLRRILCLLVRGYLPASKATIQKREQARQPKLKPDNHPPTLRHIPCFSSPPLLVSRDYDEVFEKKGETMVIERPSDEARKNRA